MKLLAKQKYVSTRLTYFPKRLIVNNKDIHDNKSIAETFNNYFINVGPNLAVNIPETARNFESYLKDNDLTQGEYNITDKEFEKAFFSIKCNKSPGYDKISSNVIKEVCNYIRKPLNGYLTCQ